MRDILYRRGDVSDRDKLQALGILAYGQYKEEMTPENWAKYNGFMSAPETFEYLMETSTCFLCESEGEIVGMAFLVSSGHPTTMFEAEWSYIRMVAVHPDYSGRGIAKILTQQCIEYAISTNEKYVALHTSEFMSAARHIYESLGFTIHKELELRYGKRYWIYILEC